MYEECFLSTSMSQILHRTYLYLKIVHTYTQKLSIVDLAFECNWAACNESGVGLHPAGPTKPCACPASRPKKEPGVSNRDANALMKGRVYMSEARSWSDASPRVAGSTQDMLVLASRGGGGKDNS